MNFLTFNVDALQAIKDVQELDIQNEDKLVLLMKQGELDILRKIYDIVETQTRRQEKKEKTLSNLRKAEEERLLSFFRSTT